MLLDAEDGNSSKRLSAHPARGDVVSFIQQLLLDSLLMPPPSKPPHTVDYVLDVSTVALVLLQAIKIFFHSHSNVFFMSML